MGGRARSAGAERKKQGEQRGERRSLGGPKKSRSVKTPQEPEDGSDTIEVAPARI